VENKEDEAKAGKKEETGNEEEKSQDKRWMP
jgi:hypothetical protein